MSLVCTDEDGGTTVTAQTANVDLDPGETATCTYTNSRKGSIVVQKQTSPDGDPQAFAFSASYDADGFSLTDGQSNDSGPLSAGTYSVSETVPAGWDLQSAACSDGSPPGSIALAAGETVTCVFTNAKRGRIVDKVTVGERPAELRLRADGRRTGSTRASRSRTRRRPHDSASSSRARTRPPRPCPRAGASRAPPAATAPHLARSTSVRARRSPAHSRTPSRRGSSSRSRRTPTARRSRSPSAPATTRTASRWRTGIRTTRATSPGHLLGLRTCPRDGA